MGLRQHYQAIKYFVHPPPKIEDKSPEELTSRAERAILDTVSTKSDDSITKEKNGDPPASANGLECTVRNLYKDRKNNWTEKYPYWIDEPAESSTSISPFALIVRNRKSNDTRKKFEIESFTIQSPFLKRALGTVLAGYPGVTTELERLEFKSPFEPFVHRWHAFEQATVNEKHTETKQHLALLWNVLEPDLKDLLAKVKDYERHGIIDYKHLWTIFEPDCLVLKRVDDSDRVYRCLRAHHKDGGFDLDVQYVDTDGTRFGHVTKSLSIAQFSGTRALKDLSIMPFDRHPNKNEIEQRLIARGKDFERLNSGCFKYYDGLAYSASKGSTARFNVQSRIMVDTAAYNDFNPDNQYKIHRFKGHPSSRPLTNTHLLLATDTLRAYSLRDKKWLHVFILHIGLIDFSPQAFDALVLPPSSKSLIHAFASAQVCAHSGAHHDAHTLPTPANLGEQVGLGGDVIQGKGLGTVVLLSGPPGVGKTLTAESIAESMQCPLYTLSAGDLGTNPADVERVLTRTLDMCARWRAILLLDEADVFLTSRNASDLERNKLVSIFLRVLEYHRGLMFLTTNRLADIDAAFESRIHLSLRYKELDPAARMTVWKERLAAVGGGRGGFGEEQVQRFAKVEMNGRQIKNAVRSAKVLADAHGEETGVKHVDIVLKVREENSDGVGYGQA